MTEEQRKGVSEESIIPPLQRFDVERINRAIGKKFLEGRKQHGFSQSQLGSLTNRSFQQIQKYEKGINRIPPEIFLYLAYIWNQDISSFFPSPVECFGKKTESFDPSEYEFEIDFRVARLLENLPHRIKRSIKALIYAAAEGNSSLSPLTVISLESNNPSENKMEPESV